MIALLLAASEATNSQITWPEAIVYSVGIVVGGVLLYALLFK